MRRIAVLLLSLSLTAGAFADVIKKGFSVADGGTLRIDGAYGDIRVVSQLPGGDHTIFVGEVVSVRTSSSGEAPLVYYRSGYRKLA